MVNETNYVQMRTVFLDSLPIRSVRETYERECEWTVFITTGVRERKKKGKEGEACFLARTCNFSQVFIACDERRKPSDRGKALPR